MASLLLLSTAVAVPQTYISSRLSNAFSRVSDDRKFSPATTSAFFNGLRKQRQAFAITISRYRPSEVEEVESVGKCQSLLRYRRPPSAIPMLMAFGAAPPLQHIRKEGSTI